MINKSVLYLFMMMLPMVVGCHGENNAATVDVVRPVDAPMPLQWLPDGKQLLVDNKWIYNPANKMFQPLPNPATDNPRPTWKVLPALDGKQLLWFDSQQQLAITMLDKTSGTRQSIPNWLESKEVQQLVNVVFWLNDHEVFVQQLDADKPMTQACGVFDVTKQAWTKLDKGCLISAFVHTFRVDPLSVGNYAVYSSGEGQNAVEIMQFNPRMVPLRQLLQGTLQIDAPPPAQIVMQDKARATVLYSCELLLNDDRPHCKANTENHWALYDWDMGSTHLKPMRGNLPPGITLSPTQEQFAWIRKGEVCVGDPDVATQTCTPLPTQK